jgi:hypothetical protein
MENNIAIGSAFSIGPSILTRGYSGSTFSVNGTDFFTSTVAVGSLFYMTTVDDGDINSSYSKVYYLYVGRTGR